MIYSYTGKLGVGVDVQKYLKAQSSLKTELEKRWQAGALGLFEIEVNLCPVICDSKIARDFLEPNRTEVDARVIYLSMIVDVVQFNEMSGVDAMKMFAEGLAASRELAKQFSPSDEQIMLLQDSLVF